MVNSRVVWTIRTIALLAGLFALALAVRVVYAVLAPYIDPLLRQNPLWGDGAGYHQIALGLLQQHIFSFDGQHPTSFRSPGYPAFLALLYAVFGVQLPVVRIAQALVGAFLCIPVFLIAWRLIGPKTAWTAGLVIALHPLLIVTTGWLYAETLFLSVFWLGLLLLVHLLVQGQTRHLLMAGAVLGTAVLMRPESIALVLFCVLLGFLLGLSKHQIRQLVVLQVLVLLVLLPWILRNVLVHNDFVLATTNTGVNLYGGNNPLADGGFVSERPYVLPNMSELESDRQFTREALVWIAQHPLEFVGLWPAKLVRFFSPLELGTSETLPGILSKVVTIANIIYGLWLMLACFGVVLLVRAHSKIGLVVLLAPVLYFVSLALIFFGATRFALPIAPALAILASYAVIWSVERLVGREFR